jgi:hypothetical protein
MSPITFSGNSVLPHVGHFVIWTLLDHNVVTTEDFHIN